MRRALAAVALLAAAAAPAALPPPGAGSSGERRSAEQRLYRAQGYAHCITANRVFSPGGVALIECRCAVDQLIDERGNDLPSLDERNVLTVLDPYLKQCRSGAVEGGKVPTSSAPTERVDGAAPDDKPIATADAPAPAADTQAKRPEPAWLAWTGLPVWALWLFPMFALLAGLVLLTTRRRRGGRGDLIGPPPSMRGDVGAGPGERD